MKKMKISEEEVAKVASALFEYWGNEVYPEVVIDCFGGRPDLVGTRPIGDSGKSWLSVCECKSSLTYPVLEQICRWHMEADFVKNNDWCKNKEDRTAIPHFLWVASGNSRSSKQHCLKKYLLEKFRIGWIDIEVDQELLGWQLTEDYYTDSYPEGEIKHSTDDYGYIRFGSRVYSYRILKEAKFQHGSRGTAQRLVDKLCPEMKQATAGVKADKANFMTPFKLTLLRVITNMEEGKYYRPQQLLELVQQHGGHHYASDRSFLSSIGKWLVKFDHCETDGAWHPRYKLKNKS